MVKKRKNSEQKNISEINEQINFMSNQQPKHEDFQAESRPSS